MKDSLNKNYAGIDLGTNSVRLLIVNSQNEIVLSESNRVKLGEGMFLNNSFSSEAINRTVEAFVFFSKIIKENNVCKVRAVGTAACRTAQNIDILIDKIKHQSGIDLQVISGEEEAYLTTLGACDVLKEKTENTIFCDIGGGSTELILTQNYPSMKIIDKISIPYGGVNLTEILKIYSFDGDFISKINQLIQLPISNFIKKNDIKNKFPKIKFVGISGVVLRIASITNNLKKYDKYEAHGHCIKKDNFDVFFKQYQKMDIQTLEKSPYLREGLGCIFMSGSAIFSKILELTQINEVTASLSGIKEGVVKSLIDN